MREGRGRRKGTYNPAPIAPRKIAPTVLSNVCVIDGNCIGAIASSFVVLSKVEDGRVVKDRERKGRARLKLPTSKRKQKDPRNQP